MNRFEQSFSIGVFKPVNPDFGTRLRARIELLSHRCKARHRHRVAAKRNRVAAVDGDNAQGRARTFAAALSGETLQRNGDLARTGVFERDDLSRG